MATTTLNFQNITLNMSIQIGDLIFYTNSVNQSGGFQTSFQDGVILLGTITNVNNNLITVEGEDGLDEPQALNMGGGPALNPSFFFFAKDNRANLSSIAGYFGKAIFKNNSTESAELFTAACDLTQSSK
tara:strand:+ start:241 stop:627 length:387 start_codon:yes stop_codon:yes gene_type:complete